MPCESHKDALIEAAASGVEPRGELRAHLADCTACRAAFEQEQALFASIDSGLQATANTEVPVSLLPRVRACLDEESAPRRVWGTNWLVFLSAAVLVAVFFTARAVWRPSIVQNPIESAGKPNVLPPQKHDPRGFRSVEKNPSSQPQVAAVRNPSARETSSRVESKPATLVPRDQEVLLAEYAEQWHQRKHVPLVAQDSDTMVLAPLQVAQIQIAELDVKLLADEKSQ